MPKIPHDVPMRNFVIEVVESVAPPDKVDVQLWWLFAALCAAGLILL